MITDASELAVSAILEQSDDAGAWHPVAYESRKLTAPKRAYSPHLLELLAVVHALKILRPYLLDRPFELHTDSPLDGPFQDSRQDRPNTYRLAVPAAWCAFNEFNVERLRRYLSRPLELGGDADEPPPVVAQDGFLEHKVAAILQFREACARKARRCWSAGLAKTLPARIGSRWRT